MLEGLRQTANRLILLPRKWTLLLSFVIGALSALGQAPFHFFPLLWFTFPLLVLLLDGAVSSIESRGLSRLMPAFWVGYIFGFGYFVASLWWLGSAFLVNAETFAWLLPLAVIGLPLLLALFFGLATAIARIFWQDGWSRIVVLAISLGFFEWARGTILTGFPWNLLGYFLAPNDIMMQAISILGIYIYGILAVLIFATPVLIFDQPDEQPRRNKAFFIFVSTIVVALIGFGGLRLSNVKDEFVADVQLRIIQPNILQKDKFKPEKAKEIVGRYLDMSARSTRPGDLGLLSTTHLIWPESAFPFFLTEQPSVLAAIDKLLPTGTTLLTGAVRAEPKRAGQQTRKVYNSLYTISHTGEIQDAYDKVHLVPFGEYLPFQDFLESLGFLALVETPGGFSAGPRRRSVNTSNAPPFIPMICYEIVFPFQISKANRNSDVEWILNITNDAWFGLTPGPHQHFHQTKVRAVDEGLPVVRAANSGISAVIDGYGRVQQRLHLGESGIIDSQLPVKVVLLWDSDIKQLLFWVIIFSATILMGARRLVRSR
ncbi:MAG: apolipoprotein N-acyltransferase [Hyphomicrobiales bacterium]